MHVFAFVSGGFSQEDAEEEEDHINFVLMTKKGNKQQFATLNVPISAEFATKFREREEVNDCCLYTSDLSAIYMPLQSKIQSRT